MTVPFVIEATVPMPIRTVAARPTLMCARLAAAREIHTVAMPFAALFELTWTRDPVRQHGLQALRHQLQVDVERGAGCTGAGKSTCGGAAGWPFEPSTWTVWVMLAVLPPRSVTVSVTW